MIYSIENKYKNYIDIYENVLPNLHDVNAKRFLENSLYLSVFTSFEFFIKNMIDNYIDYLVGKEIRYIDLDEPLARKFILEMEKCIQNIYQENEEKSKNAFKAFFIRISEPLSKQELSRHIKFEFFHESKIKTHYEVMFKQMLGMPNFLQSIKITRNIEDGSEMEQIESVDGMTFVCNYCKEIRNNIAHTNDSYSISAIFSMSFVDVVNAFQKIMKEMKNRYEEYNCSSLDVSVRENILDAI